MTYDLTEDAKEDLIQIYDYGADTWGPLQATNYYLDLHDKFDVIADQPDRYMSVEHLGVGIRRCVHRSHSIYFDTRRDKTLILRIIRSQNIDQLN